MTIRNPNSTRTSGGIEVTIAADAAFAKRIASTTTLTLPGTALDVGALTDIELSVADAGNQRVVQESIGEMEVKFTTTTTIPGSDAKAGYRQGAHIFFPSAFQFLDAGLAAEWDGKPASIDRDEEGAC